MAGSRPPASPPEAEPPKIERLKTRADFLRAQKGVRRRMTGLSLEACASPDDVRTDTRLRVGFTASRKVGGAVERNRAKRRLRAAAAALLPLYGRPGNDYVLIAKTETLSRPFADLLADLAEALDGAHRRLETVSPERGRAGGPMRE